MDDPDVTVPLAKSALPSSEAPRVSDELTNSQVYAALGACLPASRASTSPHSWQPPSVEQLQRALPQYEVQSLIARGGMGAVYKGIQKTLRRTVAIKVLPPDLVDDDMQFAGRFKHEAQAMAQLSHPRIVAVFDAGETPDGLLYFVMEFIEGTDVARLIASEGRIDPQRALSIISAVCEALDFAHESGIIHRDIKPSNIMLDKKGRVKVADFGLAKAVNVESTLLTGSNISMGTPDFIAPEALIAGMKVDQRADLYAVGVMLYQMLTGRIPRGRFQLPSGMVPQIDPAFDAIVDKAMQTDREKRYSTAGEMKADVERITTKERHLASAVIGTETGPGESRSLKRPLLFTLSVTVAVFACGGWWLLKSGYQGRSANHGSAPIVTSTSPTALEPGAIRLWDTPEKLPADAGVHWENQALVLGDETRIGTLKYNEKPSRNAMLRASVRMNATSERYLPQIDLRMHNEGSINESGYRLAVRSDGGVQLEVFVTNHDATRLKVWLLPRRYGPDEWLRLELRAVDDRFTVLADGEVLGTVQDTTITAAGDVMIGAQNGSFRDIVYVPLDKPGTVAPAVATPDQPPPPRVNEPALAGSKTPPPVPVAGKPQWQPLEWRADALTNPGITQEAGWYHFTVSNAVMHDSDNYNDSQRISDRAVRCRIRTGQKGGGLKIDMEAPDSRTGTYYLLLETPSKAVIRSYDGAKKGETTLAELKLSPPIPAGSEVMMEFAVYGNVLVGRVDGKVVGPVHDDSIPTRFGTAIQLGGGPGLDAWLKDAEYLDLTGLADPEAALGWSKLEGPAAPAAPKPAPSATTSANLPTAKPGEWLDLMSWAQKAKASAGWKLENGSLIVPHRKITVALSIPLPMKDGAHPIEIACPNGFPTGIASHSRTYAARPVERG